ncbi:hypothetical protein AURDEDRAFT_154375 [Auricularia subglabra TFB-10046 SS5]|nr:hypothetical protein AURDEDRAFT_154375 [Auricularia subglabra TFB-10046 SS5]
MSLAQKILAAAERHAAILSELSSLDHVSAALALQVKKVDEIQELVKEAVTRGQEAELEKIKEWRRHRSFQGPGVRKLAAKMVGRGDEWKEKATKEEQAYVDTIEAEKQAKEALEGLRADHVEAKQHLEKLQLESTRRELFQRELVELYAQIFDGPTPEALQDDHLEWALRLVDDENNREQADLNHEKKTLELLTEAQKTAYEIQKKMSEAVTHGGLDILNSRAAIKAAETKAVTEAQMLLKQYDTLVEQARRLHPAMTTLPTIKITPLQREIFFDNIISDMAQQVGR